jgi:hypothetical protein
VTGVRVTGHVEPERRVVIVFDDKYVVDTEPDVQVALPVEVARAFRDRLVDEIDGLLGTKWVR